MVSSARPTAGVNLAWLELATGASPAGLNGPTSAPPATRPLTLGERELFEPAFETDFSGVRVHQGLEPTRAAIRQGALAYTTAQDIVWSARAGPRDSPAGRRVLAHELAHVVQQSGSSAASTSVSSIGYEWEADRAASAAVEGRRADGLSAAPLGAVQKQTDPTTTATTTPPTTTAATAGPTVPRGAFTVFGLMLGIYFRGTLVTYAIGLPPEYQAPFQARPELGDLFAAAVSDVWNTYGGRETATFMQSEAMLTALMADLPTWLIVGTLPTVTTLLSTRATTMGRVRIRAEVDRALRGVAIDPVAVNWNMEIPWLRANPPLAPRTLIEASQLDRYQFVLDLLAAEVSPFEAAIGTPPDRALLRDSLFDFATHFTFADSVQQQFSEKFLDVFAPQLDALRYVPDPFDLSRLGWVSRAAIDAERERLLVQFLRNDAPGLMTTYILDDWTGSGASAERFLSTLDLDAYRESIVDRLAKKFVDAARTDPRLAGALRDAAAEEGRHRTARVIYAAGRALEAWHHRFLDRARTEPIENLDQFELEVASSPSDYLNRSTNVANASRQVLEQSLAPDAFRAALADLGAALVIAKALPERFGGLPEWLALFQALASYQDLLATQQKEATDLIRDRFRVGYDEVAPIVRAHVDFAERFIEDKWIPMLKTVALERITANRNQLQAWLDDFETKTDIAWARYEIGALSLERVAKGLRDGVYDKVFIEDQVITAADVDKVEVAAQVLHSQADKLKTPAGRYLKRKKLEAAIGAFEDVRKRILDGTYKPDQYGSAVFVEARQRLGIGWFNDPAFATYGMVLTRRVVAQDTPFLAHAIVSWQFHEELSEEMWALAKALGLGVLSLAAVLSNLLVPGVGASILMWIDVGAGLVMGGKGVIDAMRLVDMARLDTDLSVRGVTEQQAEAALTHAWVNLAVSMVLAFGPLALGRLLKYITRTGTTALEMGNIARLEAVDAAGLARLTNLVKDITLLDRLIGLTGTNAVRLESLLAYVRDAAELEALLGRVKNAETLESCLIAINQARGSGATMTRMLEGVTDVDRLHGIFIDLGEVRIARFGAMRGGELLGSIDAVGYKYIKGLADEYSGPALQARIRGLVEERAGLSGEAAALRKSVLPGKAISHNNVASVHYASSTGTDFRQQATSKGRGPLPDRPTPRSKGGQFEPSVDTGSKRLMDTDAEYKLLDWLGQKLDAEHPGSPQDARGTVNLYSEMQLCESCQSIVSQFRAKFPNVKIYVFADVPYVPK